MNELIKYSEQTFESIKHVNEYGEEYWLARELQPSWNMPSGAGSRMPSSAQNLPVRIVALRLRTILPTSAKWLTSAPVQNVRSMMSCFPGMLAT